MENLHDKQSKVSEEQLQDRIKSYEEDILSYAKQLADETTTSGLMMNLNEVISYAMDAAKNGVKKGSILNVLWYLSDVLHKAGSIIELVQYIERDTAELSAMRSSQPLTSK